MPNAKRAPKPRTIPYPQPTERGGEIAIFMRVPGQIYVKTFGVALHSKV
jgi:hypothetical protein